MNISQLKRDLETVKHALSRDKQGYDEDGYNEQGLDRYGRSREIMQHAAELDQKAFDSLTPEQQALCQKAEAICQKYEKKANEWESQPLKVRKKDPFYEEYMMHSDITKHSFLMGVWMTKEEGALTDQACHIMIEARNKIEPSNRGMTH
jgi:hypothetical protein